MYLQKIWDKFFESDAPKWKKALWIVPLVIITILLVVWLGVRYGCSPESKPSFELARKRGEHVDASIEEYKKRDEELALQEEKLRAERNEEIDEVVASAEGRQDFNEAVDDAVDSGSVDAVHNVRRRGRRR